MAHLKIGNTSKGAVSAACLKQPSMNPQPTRKGFIFWITSPSGNLDSTSKSISAWNIFCLMPSRGELEHFDPPPLLDQKKTDQKIYPTTIEIYFCKILLIPVFCIF